MKREEKIKKQRKARRTARTRGKILYHKSSPRLSVFRSNKYIYAQIIDDVNGKTLVGVNERELPKTDKMTKIQKAQEIGKLIAKKAMDKKIKKVVFDKGPYRYHGRVKALADSAREGGISF